MDICTIIQRQHDEQRTQFGYLEQWPRDDVKGLGAVWQRLAILLETHAAAEEKHFYPQLLALGTGAADAGGATEHQRADQHPCRQAPAADLPLGTLGAVVLVGRLQVGGQLAGGFWSVVVRLLRRPVRVVHGSHGAAAT